MKVDYVVHADVLIIGGGGAGIKAAIEAARNGADTLIVTKRKFATTGSTFYPGTSGWGMDAVLFPGDTADAFTEEILDAGAGCADPVLARILAEDCTRRFHELESYGIEFLTDESGGYHGVIPCFGKRLRGSSAFGIDMIRTQLWKQLMIRHVRIRDEVSIISLVVRDGTCHGAVGIDEMNCLVFFHAASTVLATGGACGLYTYGLATADQTGDGYQLALDAGAELVNLEFIQFIPGLTWPVRKLLFQEKNLDTIPQVTNRKGEPVLERYLPPGISVEECLTERARHGPFSTAACGRYFDIALYEQWMQDLALDSGGLHLQYRPSILNDTRWYITTWIDWMKSKHIDVVNRGFDILPHAQCFNGGIRIDKHCRTGVDGLFAAGETAGGPHGADRLGGAAIAATQVFGALAGIEAASWAASHRRTEMNPADATDGLEESLGNPSGGKVDIPASLSKVRSILWTCGAICRSEDRCTAGLHRLGDLAHSFDPLAYFPRDRGMKQAVVLRNALQISAVLLSSMKERRESRGPHYRMDYPEPNALYRGMLGIRRHNGGYTFTMETDTGAVRTIL